MDKFYSRFFENLKHKICKIYFSNEEQKRLSIYKNSVCYIIENKYLSDIQKKSIIVKIIKVLSLNIQNYLVEELLPHIKTAKTSSSEPLFPLYLKCPTCFFCTDYSSKDITSLNHFISLNTTPVIASLWNPSRMINAFSNIGQIPNNHFKYDEKNHFANIFIYPIGLVLITNGLHSATTGIYDSNGSLPLQECFDISSFYNEVTFDGIDFIHQKCGNIIYKPQHKDIGIIYEIGRLLLNNNLVILPTDLP